MTPTAEAAACPDNQEPDTQLDLQNPHPDVRRSGSEKSCQQEQARTGTPELGLLAASQPVPEPTLAPAPTMAAAGGLSPGSGQSEGIPSQVEPSGINSGQAPGVETGLVAPTSEPDRFISGVEQWRSLVASIFPAAAVETVLRIMRCESSGRADAVSPTDDHGLMQINRQNHWRFGGRSPYDPVANLEVAYAMSGGGTNWAPWSCR